MAASAKELEYKLMNEYSRARATLLDGFGLPSDKKYAHDYIQSTLLVCTEKQAEIILKDLPDSFLSGVYIESDYLRDRVPAYTGVDLTKVSKTHLNRISKDTIGSIGTYNKAISADLVKQHNILLANNELVNSISAHGWTKNAERRMVKAGFDKEIIELVKTQTTANKMVKILEMQGIQGGMHPYDVSELLQPHIRNVFGDGGVLIDNTGEMRRQFTIDADGKYKWIQKKVTKPYRATIKTYSETISRSSMLQAHIDGRTATLKKSNLVEKYRSIANMTANTCSHCAMMHGQIVTQADGPEYHANCSCRLSPVWKKETGLANHTDEFYENQRNQHFWKQHQLKEYNKTLPKGKKIPNYNFLPADKLKGMPGKEGMRKIRAEMLKEPLVIKPKKVITKPKITALDTAKINSNHPKIQKDLTSLDVDNNLLKLSDKLKFSEDEKLALQMYKGAAYVPINKYLRKGIAKSAYVKGELKKHIKHLDTAMKKSKLPRDVTVFRGISPRTANMLMKENTCTDLGYSSTSYRPKTALSFASTGEDGYTNMMAFKYKKGANALMWNEEAEILGARGLKLKCIEIKEVSKLEIAYGKEYAGRPDNIRMFIMEVQ